jgi:hypothetical protein
LEFQELRRRLKSINKPIAPSKTEDVSGTEATVGSVLPSE